MIQPMIQSTPMWTDIVNAIANAFIAITAVAVAFFGLRQWRRETVGRSQYELARRIALLAFRCRAQVHEFRNPFTFASEYADRNIPDDETPEQKQQRNEEFAKWSRLKPIHKTVLELREATWEADMLLKHSIDPLISPILDVYGELIDAVRIYYPSTISQHLISTPILSDDMSRQLSARLYGVPGDELGQHVETIVNNLAEDLKQYTR